MRTHFIWQTEEEKIPQQRKMHIFMAHVCVIPTHLFSKCKIVFRMSLDILY